MMAASVCTSGTGLEMLDENGNQVEFGAKKDFASLNQSQLAMCCQSFQNVHSVLPAMSQNPLCGSTGCSAVFGPQKGADPEMINMMDHWLKDYTSLSRKCFPDANKSLSGAGAVACFAFVFCMPRLICIKIVLEETKRDYIQNADIVVTGEGRLDGQTVMGKAPIGVAKIAKEYGKPVIAPFLAVSQRCHRLQ